MNDYAQILSNWKHHLDSATHPLFRRLSIKQEHIVGPRITGQGLQGTLFSVETTLFSHYASEEQYRFYQWLEHDKVKQNEYVITIINGMDKWKDDVRILLKTLPQLKESEAILRKEEFYAEHDELKDLKRLKELLGAHGQDVDQMITTIQEFIAELKKEDAKLSRLISDVDDLMKVLGKDFPFLF